MKVATLRSRIMRRLRAAGAGVVILALAIGLLQSVPSTAALSGSCTGWKSTVLPPRTINVLRTAQGRVEKVRFRPARRWWIDPRLAGWEIKTVAGDFDGDGRNDLVFVTREGDSGVRIQLLRSNGQRFVSRMLLSVPASFAWDATRVASANLDGDGLDDLLVVYDDVPMRLTSVLETHAWLSRATSLVDARWGAEATLD